MTEQRKHDRIFLDRAISIKLSNGQIAKARLVNLSTGGLGIVYPVPAEIGSTLGLHFQLPNKDNEPVTIHCKGIARHTHVHNNEYLSGFEFSQISEEDRNIISQFVQRKRTATNF